VSHCAQLLTGGKSTIHILHVCDVSTSHFIYISNAPHQEVSLHLLSASS
jgi:hypothetical protein